MQVKWNFTLGLELFSLHMYLQQNWSKFPLTFFPQHPFLSINNERFSFVRKIISFFFLPKIFCKQITWHFKDVLGYLISIFHSKKKSQSYFLNFFFFSFLSQTIFKPSTWINQGGRFGAKSPGIDQLKFLAMKGALGRPHSFSESPDNLLRWPQSSPKLPQAVPLAVKPRAPRFPSTGGWCPSNGLSKHIHVQQL